MESQPQYREFSNTISMESQPLNREFSNTISMESQPHNLLKYNIYGKSAS